jgi:puromycin-sensitive aminopeptidase
MDAVIVGCISSFATHEKAKEIQEFFETHPLPSSARRIGQCLENIRAAANTVNTIKNSNLMEISFWR